MFSHQELLEQMPRLEKFAHKLCKTDEKAEDLLQATLLKAIEKKEMFETDSNLFGWTSKIMYNDFVSKYRRRVKRTTQYDPENYINAQKRAPAQPQTLDAKITREAIDALGDIHREILVMVCIKGMAYKEAAAALDIPIGTVRSRLARARELLQASLDDQATMIHNEPYVTRQVPFRSAA